MYVYYELIVFLYLGANTFCMFDCSEFIQYLKLLMLCVLLVFVYCLMNLNRNLNRVSQENRRIARYS